MRLIEKGGIRLIRGEKLNMPIYIYSVSDGC
jgi:hypothetical protein